MTTNNWEQFDMESEYDDTPVSEFDVVLCATDLDSGFRFEDVVDLFDMLNEDSAVPLEIVAEQTKAHAIGFITTTKANLLLDGKCVESDFRKFIIDLVNDMAMADGEHIFTYRGVNIWLSEG